MVRSGKAVRPSVVPAGTCPMGEFAVTWDEARTALAEAAAEVPGLFAKVRDPAAPAVGVWNIAELAVHMTHAWASLPNLARRDLEAMRAALPTIPGFEAGTPGGWMLSDLGQMETVTVGAVEADPERDLTALGERFEAGVASFCDGFDGDADPSFRPWIAEPIVAPPSLFACHILCETLMHGHDLAKAAGLSYVLADRHAAIVVRGFGLPMLVNVTRGQPGPELAIDLRLAGSCRLTIVYTGDGVAIEPPGRRVDSHLWMRPAALLLLMWRRRSLRAVVGRRESFVWGRRPWTALEPLKSVGKV